jgi:hypothetical protein
MVTVGGLLSAAIGGAAIGSEQFVVVLFILGGMLMLLAPHLSLTQWCTLLLISTVASRGLVVVFQLPSLVNFLHYPITCAFAIVAATRPRNERIPASRRISRWLFGLSVLALISLVANGAHPLRAGLFLTITGEPLLVLRAMARWGSHGASRRQVGIVAFTLLAIQVPIGVWQCIAFGWTDPVQGTITNSLAGSHILGALFALGLLITTAATMAGRIRKAAGFLAGCTALGMMIAAGANQVLLAVAVALLATPTLVRLNLETRNSADRIRGIVGAVLLASVFAATGLALVRHFNPSDIIGRATRLTTPDELPETRLIVTRADDSILQLLVGSGPGTTASRASLLLTPAMLKETSPLAALHLPPTAEALAIASEVRVVGGGSAEAFASGTLGVVGDVGLLGLTGLALVFLGIWKEVARPPSWHSRAVRACLVMTTVMLFVDNWLEYPEYSLPLAILIGFALPGPQTRSHEEVPPVATTRIALQPHGAYTSLKSLHD